MVGPNKSDSERNRLFQTVGVLYLEKRPIQPETLPVIFHRETNPGNSKITENKDRYNVVPKIS